MSEDRMRSSAPRVDTPTFSGSLATPPPIPSPSSKALLMREPGVARLMAGLIDVPLMVTILDWCLGNVETVDTDFFTDVSSPEPSELESEESERRIRI